MNDKVFETLFHLDVNSRVEKKKTGNTQLSYLSWAWAWAEVKKRYPEAAYKILKFENNLPYVYDPNTGYMVFTEVTIGDVTHEMWLPVMDGANNAMKAESYEYQVIKWTNGKRDGFTTKSVDPATMFDINKTIMRCLVKNLAMFGLGLYIYSGEDLPEEAPPELMSDETKEILINKIHEYIAIRGIETDEGMSQMGAWVCKQVGVKSLEVMTDPQAAAAIKGLNTLIAKEYEKAAKEEAAKEEAVEPETTKQEGLDFTYPQADAK